MCDMDERETFDSEGRLSGYSECLEMLRRHQNNYKRRIKYLEDENRKLKDEHFKDKYIQELQKENELGLILVTHNLGVVWDMCDRVMVMYAGKIVEMADVKDLYAKPMHPYTWGLLDSMPSLASERKTNLRTIAGTPPDLRLTGTCCNFYNRCPYAKPICTQTVPDLVEMEPGHFVACHRQCATETLTRGEGLQDG